MPGKLEASVYEGGMSICLSLVKNIAETATLHLQYLTHSCWLGSNLSAGQRQLISLARALLTPTNVLGKIPDMYPAYF